MWICAVPGWQLCLISEAMESDRGGDAWLEEFDGSVNVAKATSVARRAETQEAERWVCELDELADRIHR